jgi:citrate lyase subunit beta/citryl-CoA lyase
LILDLEDAVIESEKDPARQRLVELLDGPVWDRSVSVRINAPGTPWSHADVIALAALTGRPATVVVPKVESAADVMFVHRLLDGAESAARDQRIGIQALIETAAGLSRLDEIAGCSDRLVALVIGYADLAISFGRSERGADNSFAWEAARHQILTAARVNELEAIDGPYMGIEVDEGFRQSLALARDLGFDGKWVIHPAQIGPANEAFSPNSNEVDQAIRVIEALERAGADHGVGAVALDGRLLDRPVEVWARQVLRRADAERRIGASPTPGNRA